MMSESEGSELLSFWANLSSSMMETALKANRAALASGGITPVGMSKMDSDEPEVAVEGGDCRDGWVVDRSETAPEHVGVGDTVQFTKTLTAENVAQFAVASGDTNPLHLDDDAAADTRFDGRIVHGTLVGGLISAALARLPGTVIYLSQDFEFQSPVRIGDRVTAAVTVLEELGQGRYRLRTTVQKDDNVVVDGEAVVLIEQ